MMTKRLFFLLGVLAGVLFAIIAYRKRMERLKALEAQDAEVNSRYDEYARDRQAALAAMPFKERMEYELFQASLNLDNGVPSWEEDDDEVSY
jgi:hypothetical protein